MKKACVCLAVLFLAAPYLPGQSPAVTSTSAPPLTTVDSVDLERYQGVWFEIARLPVSFEKKCAQDVSATYALRPDGKMQVVNSCRKGNGSESVSNGTAVRASKDGPASRLKVTFFWPFSGSYWVLDLDPDYRWALVGTPDRKGLWILSRKPALDRETTDKLIASARAKGFAVDRLIWTRQSP
jgi:apolipoprotein D and lipocalin family protein